MTSRYDVIVVGAGFAGATTARECASRGLRVLVLEARDRIGGRSGSRVLSDGTAGDVGGTHIHWTQPHVWAEITRYGLGDQVVRGRVDADWMATYADGHTAWSPAAASDEQTRRTMTKVMAESARLFPNPAQPLQARAALEQADHLSVSEALAAMDLDAHEREEMAMTLGGWAGRPAEETSWTAIQRWFALGLDNHDDVIDMQMTWKLKCGTGGLISRIIADGGAELRLNSPVRSLASDDEGVTVTTVDGEEFTAATSVIAVPANVWAHLDISPALSPAQLEASQARMTAQWGGKAVAIIKGESRAVLFTGDDTAPISFFTQGFRGSDEQAIAIYPMDESFDISDTELMRKAITTALPHVTVVDSVGDMYRSDDPFFRGAWGFLLPGQLTKYVPHENFTRLDNRVVFASADIATLWHGFIDGAIESGLFAAREVRAQLGTR